jgi:hypothetical protein
MPAQDREDGLPQQRDEAETSCEVCNDYLDRERVAPVLSVPDAEFSQGVV